MKMSQTYHRNK